MIKKRSDSNTCCFASSSRDHPIHLWDAYTGKLRCSYRTYNQSDELIAPYSLCFNLEGSRIIGGFNNSLRFFDVSLPGREIKTINAPKKSPNDLRGIYSTINFNPDYSKLFAVGSYNNVVGIYNESDYSLISLLHNKEGSGISQVEFSPDGNYLYSASRKSEHIICWDIRNTGSILHKFPRLALSNQKYSFTIHPSGKYLITGSQVCLFSVI